jgi:transcription antitermination factor NusG
MQKKNIQTHWYLLYTNPRAEKKVAVDLQHKGYEVFLPLQRTLKVWSDRRKWVEEPLFKSYLFIQTQLEANFYQILNTPGVVKFISFQSTPAIVNPREMEIIKMIFGDQNELNTVIGVEAVEIGPWQEGEVVNIIAGPLIGTTGKLIHTRSGNKMLIELQSIQQNILVSVPHHLLRKTIPSKLQTV